MQDAAWNASTHSMWLQCDHTLHNVILLNVIISNIVDMCVRMCGYLYFWRHVGVAGCRLVWLDAFFCELLFLLRDSKFDTFYNLCIHYYGSTLNKQQTKESAFRFPVCLYTVQIPVNHHMASVSCEGSFFNFPRCKVLKWTIFTTALDISRFQSVFTV